VNKSTTLSRPVKRFTALNRLVNRFTTLRNGSGSSTNGPSRPITHEKSKRRHVKRNRTSCRLS
jgi:hypothetical protein